jgi:cytoskeleton protein RodZ
MTKMTPVSAEGDGAPSRRRIHLREISGESETPQESVGQELRAARLRRGEDLATVSRALKIRKDHLEAVEEDDLNRLPGKTYAIGFVRTYAGYMGLDAAKMVERFKQEISGRQIDHLTSASVMPDLDGRKLPYGWRIVAAVVVLVVAYGAWHLLAAGPAPQPVPPAPVINPPRRVAANPAPPRPAPQTEAVPSPALQQIPPATPVGDTATPGPAAPVSGSTASPASATNAAVSKAAAAGHVYGAQNKNSRVVLRAASDTHIAVRGADGRVFINRVLNAGDRYNVPNLVGLSLSSDNAGALEMDLDGAALGRAGADSQAIDGITLDPKAIADRFNKR